MHESRHTVATVLAILNVPTSTTMAIVGWSTAEMAKRYQHMLDSIRKGVADQVSGLLWDVPEQEQALPAANLPAVSGELTTGALVSIARGRLRIGLRAVRAVD